MGNDKLRVCSLLVIFALLPLAAPAQESKPAQLALKKAAAAKQTQGKHAVSRRSQYGRYALVPPPPPTAVSPTVLAAYPQTMGTSARLMPAKPRHLADDMRLTAVMDDIAFFKVGGADESIHLKQGKCYQNVTVAQINPDEVVLEEKGLQFVKHLR